MTGPGRHATHEVLNQVPPLAGYDVADDAALMSALAREGGDWAEQDVHELGWLAGDARTQEHARLANVHKPVLRTHDARGYRIDEVESHPSWHQLMTTAVSHGLHAAPWADPRAGAHVARAAKFMVWTQAEAGHGCPISMTYACVPAVRQAPGLAARYEPLLTATSYDPGLRAPDGKTGLLAGMAMTEKQGGSDVRANTTTAVPAGDGSYLLTGHKWFCSAPMCDLFLVLAQAPEGLTCFLLPRFLPDGSVNELRLCRLKEKLGNRSNASSEVEFEGAYAMRCGPEGEGVKTIINMVQLTRLDCVTGSLGIMRSALMQAIHHTRHRTAFQKKLADQPLMRAVLADLALEREAAIALAFRLAAAFDRAAHDADEAAFARLLTPAAKLYVCKATPGFVYEALECIGGNGYVEEGPLARLYREAPLNAIWEGSGNIMGLDILRGAGREADGAMRVLARLAKETEGLPGAPDAIKRIEHGFAAPEREALARRTGETLSLVAAAAALAASAPAAVAEAFAARRLSGLAGRNYGEPYRADLADQLINRAMARAA